MRLLTPPPLLPLLRAVEAVRTPLSLSTPLGVQMTPWRHLQPPMKLRPRLMPSLASRRRRARVRSGLRSRAAPPYRCRNR